MAKYSKSDMALALDTVTRVLDDTVRIVVTHKGGNMYRVDTVNFKGEVCSLTWALGVLMGVTVRSREGVNVLSVGGGGYSKPLHLVTSLLHYVGVEDTLQHPLTRNYVTL